MPRSTADWPSLFPSWGNPPVWNTYNVYVNSTIKVNSTFSMYNCNVKMGPNCLLTSFSTPPNNPNYRLYNFEGSPCDTLGVRSPLVAYWRSGRDTIHGPLEMQFTDLSYFKPVYWLWEFDDGTTDSSRSPLHVFPGPGTYEVCLTVCNALGECDTQCREVVIETVSTAETAYNAQGRLRLYPNPTRGEWAVEWLDESVTGPSTIIVADLSGRQVHRSQQTNRMARMSALAPGFYVVQVKREGRSYGLKLVVVE